MANCKICNTEVEDNEEYCPECGTEIKKNAGKQCDICKCINDAGAEECKNCGNEFPDAFFE